LATGALIEAGRNNRFCRSPEAVGTEHYKGNAFLSWGTGDWVGKWYRGALSDVRIYNRALTDEETVILGQP
jgi:hypothetical protein